MNKLRTIGFLLCFVAVCYALALGVHAFVNHYLDKSAANAVATCSKKGKNHTVSIKNSLAMPASTQANLCDTLTIKNADNQIRLMAFGVHEHHVPYDNVEERALEKNQSFTVTLNQAGSFRFHDHLDDSAQGTFTVHK